MAATHIGARRKITAREIQTHPLIVRLNEKLHDHLSDIEKTEVYRVISSKDTSAELGAAIVKYVLLEVFSYGAHVTEATFTAIGRMPLKNPQLMEQAVHHLLEEVSHPELALSDYLKLGGDEQWARQRRITPQAFAMAASCRMLATHEDPFAYLGYMYLFEALTPIIAQRVQTFLSDIGVKVNTQAFINVHAKEDIAHTAWMQRLIVEAVALYPESEPAVEYGFDCFRAVYPIPIWTAALAHARAELEQD